MKHCGLLSCGLRIERQDLDGHDHVFAADQTKVVAAVEVELARFFAAEAKSEESILGGKPDRADGPSGAIAFAVRVFELNDPLIGVQHGGSQHLHGRNGGAFAGGGDGDRGGSDGVEIKRGGRHDF